jgi:hypothetical protein
MDGSQKSSGSSTYVVLSRDTDPGDLADDPDTFDIIFKQGDTASIKDLVAANAFAFSATQRYGVSGLLFCTHDENSPLSNWTRSDWNP